MDFGTGIDGVSRWLGVAPAWTLSLVAFALAVALALVVYGILARILDRLVAHKDLFWRSVVSRTRGPVRLALLLVALVIASSFAPLTYSQSGIARHALVIGMIVLIASVLWTTVHIWVTVYLRRFTQDAADNLLARKHVTQTHILQRVAAFFIWTAAISAALMTFEGVRQYGVSLLASAGAAGVVVGLALQPVLKNLLAGIQIAVTQPIKIGDALLVEGEMGFVEDITATYVVIRVWDLRRLVVPLSYFIEQPFQNWTRDSTQLLGAVLIYLDYSVPLERLREKTRQIVEASPLWDGKTFAVQVTDFKQNTMEVRILVSAKDSASVFDLRCEVREKVIAFLQSECPGALPRLRTQIDAPLEGSNRQEPAREAQQRRAPH